MRIIIIFFNYKTSFSFDKKLCMLRGRLTVGFETCRLAVAAARLVDCLDEEDVAGSALEAVHSVVILLDVRHDHPTVH